MLQVKSVTRMFGAKAAVVRCAGCRGDSGRSDWLGALDETCANQFHPHSRTQDGVISLSRIRERYIMPPPDSRRANP